MKASLRSHIAFARQLTHVLDTRFNFFGIKFGIDPLLDMIPGLGNILASGTSFYLFWLALKLNVPRSIIYKMFWNIVVDYVMGVVPVVGIVFDLFYRANVKNFALIEPYFDSTIIEGEVVNV